MSTQVDILIRIQSQLQELQRTTDGILRMKAAGEAATSALGGLGRMFAAGGIFGLGALSVTGLQRAFAAAVTEGLRFNALIEQQRVAFSTLLGSVDAARVRIQQLTQFAASTPFELPEIVATSRLLQSLAGDALATGRGLQLVGDAAASVGAPLRDVGFWIGRLYAGLQAGAPVGEATMRLVELGLISGEKARELNALAESGRAVGNAFEVTSQTFARFSGAMAAQSRTLNGLLATLRDSARGLLGDLTEPLSNASRSLLEQALVITGNLDPEDPTTVRLRQILAERQAARKPAAGAAAAEDPRVAQDARISAAQEQLRLRLQIDARNQAEEDGLRQGQRNLQADLEAKRISVEQYETFRRQQIQQSYELEVASLRLANVDMATANKANEGRQGWIIKEVIARNEITDQLAKQNRLKAEAELANELAARQAKEQQRAEEEVRKSQEQAARERESALRRELELRQQLLAMDLNQIRSNFRLTPAEQFAALQDRLNAAERDGTISGAEAATGRSQLGANPASFGDQFDARWTALRAQTETLAADLSQTLLSPIQGFRDGLAHALDELLVRGATAGQFFQTMAEGIRVSMIRSFTDMVANWITSHVIMRGVSLAWSGFLSLLRAKDVVQANATEASKTPALAANATLASISSYGVAVAIGVAAIAGILASVGAFRDGGEIRGPGGPRDDRVLIRASPGEFMVNAEAYAKHGPLIRALNEDRFDAASMRPAPVTAAGGRAGDVRVNLAAFDSRQDAEKWSRSQQAETWFVDMARRTSHRWSRS